MASRFASRWFIPALFAVSVAVPVVGVGAAQAATAAVAQPGHWSPPGDDSGYGHGYGGYGHQYRHHHHPNCNNDPDSGFAMSDACPHNWDYQDPPDD
ncbi:MAG TPA: hypothetical protein VE081_11035 [Sporichthyaceae bacterium]|nr:hypothetical protein [Sporichthyaceae bacterium]